MAKRVIVIASGSTEQVALRHLTAQLTADGIDVEVRFPSRHRQLRFATVSQLINAALYDSGKAPDKFVVLVDTDSKTPDEAIDPIKSELERSSFRELHQRIHYAYAQWHLEAWFFADGVNLRNYFGDRSLGNVDTSQPDQIQNPKHHLQNLLGEKHYTAPVAGQIAAQLDANTIEQRSPSFRGFMGAVRNGAMA